MGCCGKTKAVIEIVKGSVAVAIDHYFSLPISKCDDAVRRMGICRKCIGNTWLSKKQFAVWLRKNKIKVVKNLEDLTGIELLPKQPQTKQQRHIFCRHCKCYLPGKAWRKKSKCPLGFW
jgi:hypothetical protein